MASSFGGEVLSESPILTIGFEDLEWLVRSIVSMNQMG